MIDTQKPNRPRHPDNNVDPIKMRCMRERNLYINYIDSGFTKREALYLTGKHIQANTAILESILRNTNDRFRKK